MNTFKIIPLLLCSILLSSLTSFGQTRNVDLTVRGIEEIEGQLVVLVFEKKEDFPKDQKLARNFKFPVTKKEMTVSLKGLPAQDCAIMIYHDKDNNHKCNRNFIGIPTEKIGFSNNIRPKTKVPKFDDARVPAGVTKITVELYKF